MKLYFVGTIIYYCITLAVGVFALGDHDFYNPFLLMFEILSWITLITGIMAIRLFGIHGSRARTIITLVIGFACWVLGDILLLVGLTLYGRVLSVSISDLFYLLSNPIMFIGIVNELIRARVHWRTLKSVVQIGVVLLVALLLSMSVVSLFSSYVLAQHESFLATAVAIGYVISDMSIVMASLCLLILVWTYQGGKLARSWMYLFVGLFFNSIANILNHTLRPYALVEFNTKVLCITMLYAAAYLFISYAFVSLISAIRRIQKRLQK